jgi:4-amino-4-deoxy-L-arabinose transferase-like glycosyltransferase
MSQEKKVQFFCLTLKKAMTHFISPDLQAGNREASSSADSYLKPISARAGILIVASVIVILVGQAGRELFPPDDLREVEVAREMLVDKEFVVPHLAGLPFVEKPPGFPAVVANAYRIAGGPNVTVARFVSAAFALAALSAVFLLGSRVMGLEGGALAVAVLALSMRFCRSAHEVLLDNALTAACAFTLLFTWLGLSTEALRAKRLAYAGAGFSLGIAFLMKGFVGPALFGAGFLVYLALSKRFIELRQILRPVPVISFLLPVLVWVIPFVKHASPDLVRAFFIDNHFGRALKGFASNKRPFYFYLMNIWPAFAPGSVLLPFAVHAAWKKVKVPKPEAVIFFLASAIGPMALLSLSVAKDAVYLLPAYPAFALLVAWFIEGAWREPGHRARIGGIAVALLATLSATTALMATGVLGGSPYVVAVAGMVLISSLVMCVKALQGGELRWAGTWTAVLFALAWVLWFTGPIAQYEISKDSNRPAIDQVISAAAGRDILLYKPRDEFRGAFGFYRNRTAKEVDTPADLIAELSGHQQKVVLLSRPLNAELVPDNLKDAVTTANLTLRIETIADYNVNHKKHRQLVLLKADKLAEPR